MQHLTLSALCLNWKWEQVHSTLNVQWTSEYWTPEIWTFRVSDTFCLVCKCYLSCEYTDHLNTRLNIGRCSDAIIKTDYIFSNQTGFNQMNTTLVWHSDVFCTTFWCLPKSIVYQISFTSKHSKFGFRVWH